MCVQYCSEVAFSFLPISIMLINYKAQLLVSFCIVTYMEYDAPPAFPQALRGFPQRQPFASSLDLPADWRSKFDPQTGRVFYYRLTADHQAVVTESVTWSRPTPPPPLVLKPRCARRWNLRKLQGLCSAHANLYEDWTMIDGSFTNEDDDFIVY